MAQLATLAQESRKASQYSAALGCINTMAKMAKIVK
jgi:hypothetical protein